MILLIAMSIAFIGLTTSTLLSAKGGEKSFLTFTLIYSISFGICNGLSYTIPLKVCWDHFPNNKGLVSGLIIGGFGLGSFLFGLLSTLLINPKNAKPDI